MVQQSTEWRSAYADMNPPDGGRATEQGKKPKVRNFSKPKRTKDTMKQAVYKWGKRKRPSAPSLHPRSLRGKAGPSRGKSRR